MILPLAAFFAGFLNFLLPCVIAIVPVQIAVLGLRNKNRGKFAAFWRALPFVLGFMGVFMLLGLTVNSLALILAPWRGQIQIFGGIVLVVWGLSLLGVLRVPIFYATFTARLLKVLGSARGPVSSSSHSTSSADSGSERDQNRSFSLRALTGTPSAESNSAGTFDSAATATPAGLFLLGAFLAFAWTPCIGPTLALILFWASQAATFWQGAGLMFFFGLGMAVPFLALSLVLDFVTPYLGFLRRAGYVFERVSAVLVIVPGILLATGRFGILIGWALKIVS